MARDEFNEIDYSNEPRSKTDAEAAADLARAKIEAIHQQKQEAQQNAYKGEVESPQQPQEQHIEQKGKHTTEPTESYQTFHIPGHVTQPQTSKPETVTPSEHSEVETPKEQWPLVQPYDQSPTQHDSQQSNEILHDPFTPQSPEQTTPTIHQPETHSFGEAHLPQPTTQSNPFYDRESSIQSQFDPSNPHIQPDHQLRAENPHYELPENTSKKKGILKPIMRTLGVALLFAVFYYHQLVVGQVQHYINPAQSVVSPEIIQPTVEANIGNDPRIIIPKINVDVPVVYDIKSFDEEAVQNGLERGVVHYGTTPVPGENGNNVIVGHSSNSFWNSGKYKFAFVLLDRLENGDTFALHYEGKRYVYEVFQKKVVAPEESSVVFEDYGAPVTTLITCTPPGTAWRRLVVVARQISPDPDAAETPVETPVPQEDTVIPGDNTDSLWDKVQDWLN